MTGRKTTCSASGTSLVCPLRYLSICSGIEAASVAWEPLGWQPVGFSEIEPFPSAVLAHHWPDVPNLGDMTKHNEWTATLRPDIIVGGTPCQAFSVAGLRKGLDDPRGNLTLVFLGLLAQFRPRWVVWENVPGVLSDRTGAFGAFLGGLGELGYGFAYRILDAQYFGVAQRRRRVFVVGYLGDWRCAAAVLFEPESLRGDSPPRREAGQGLAQPVAGCLGSRGVRSHTELDGHGAYVPTVANGHMTASTSDISHCLNAGGMGRQDYETETLITHSLRGEGFDASEDGTGRGTPLVPVAFAHQGGGIQTTLGYNAEAKTCMTLSANQTPAIAFETRVARNGRGAPSEVVPPLKAQSGETGKGDAAPCVATGMAVRRLTPRECERLQGFPDDHTLIPWRGKQAPDGPRYKALGNSMAVPVMRWIGKRIQSLMDSDP